MNTTPNEQFYPSLLKTVGEIVAEDYRTAKVFETYGIDFCCGGKSTLEAICREKGVDPARLQSALAGVKSTPAERGHNYAAWALSFLADYIVNTHHVYLDENIASIAAYTQKIAGVHGGHHPEVIEIESIFGKIATDMAAHLREEEEILFPAIKKIEAARIAGQAPAAEDVEILKASLVRLDRDHQEIGDAVHLIRRLAGNYAVPAGVCNTFAVTWRKLEEFEDDLHKHVHLENNILFPKAAVQAQI